VVLGRCFLRPVGGVQGAPPPAASGGSQVNIQYASAATAPNFTA
jgi:hypothetical protein